MIFYFKQSICVNCVLFECGLLKSGKIPILFNDINVARELFTAKCFIHSIYAVTGKSLLAKCKITNLKNFLKRTATCAVKTKKRYFAF